MQGSEQLHQKILYLLKMCIFPLLLSSICHLKQSFFHVNKSHLFLSGYFWLTMGCKCHWRTPNFAAYAWPRSSPQQKGVHVYVPTYCCAHFPLCPRIIVPTCHSIHTPLNWTLKIWCETVSLCPCVTVPMIIHWCAHKPMCPQSHVPTH